MRLLFLSLSVCLAGHLGSAQSTTETVFHRFAGHAPTGDGAYGIPAAGYGGLKADGKGNLFGTTRYGGTSTWCDLADSHTGCGTVFELSPPTSPGGLWTTTILYSFGPSSGGDGVYPSGGLAIDSAGNLYGSTATGQGAMEPGIIFQISPPASSGAPWTESVIYVFGHSSNGAADGFNANGSLVMDASGNLYGTTNDGGAYAGGVVFELSPPSSSGAPWTETILYEFGATRADGSYPLGGVVLNQSGDLLGGTTSGGRGYGDVYELIPPAISGAPWTHRVLYTFQNQSDGGGVVGSLAIHGTNIYGGSGHGVFQLTSAGSTVIYPEQQNTGVIVDAAGNVYGSTYGLGAYNAGSVFQLSPPAAAGGAWTAITLYSFTGGSDGANPDSALIFGPSGDLFGLTVAGGNSHCSVEGSSGCGVIFRIVP